MRPAGPTLVKCRPPLTALSGCHIRPEPGIACAQPSPAVTFGRSRASHALSPLRLSHSAGAGHRMRSALSGCHIRPEPGIACAQPSPAEGGASARTSPSRGGSPCHHAPTSMRSIGSRRLPMVVRIVWPPAGAIGSGCDCVKAADTSAAVTALPDVMPRGISWLRTTRSSAPTSPMRAGTGAMSTARCSSWWVFHLVAKARERHYATL
jgi:hypothetical protein